MLIDASLAKGLARSAHRKGVLARSRFLDSVIDAITPFSRRLLEGRKIPEATVIQTAAHLKTRLAEQYPGAQIQLARQGKQRLVRTCCVTAQVLKVDGAAAGDEERVFVLDSYFFLFSPSRFVLFDRMMPTMADIHASARFMQRTNLAQADFDREYEELSLFAIPLINARNPRGTAPSARPRIAIPFLDGLALGQTNMVRYQGAQFGVKMDLDGFNDLPIDHPFLADDILRYLDIRTFIPAEYFSAAQRNVYNFLTEYKRRYAIVLRELRWNMLERPTSTLFGSALCQQALDELVGYMQSHYWQKATHRDETSALV